MSATRDILPPPPGENSPYASCSMFGRVMRSVGVTLHYRPTRVADPFVLVGSGSVFFKGPDSEVYLYSTKRLDPDS